MKKNGPLHFIFLGIPSRGHTFPTFRLIDALIKEGCKVTYFNTKAFKRDIETCGAFFVDYDSHSLSNISISITTMEPHEVTIELQKIFFKSALEIMPIIDFFHKKNSYDAVIYDQIALWGQLFADKHKLLSFCSNTMFLFNKVDILNQIPRLLEGINPEYQMQLNELNSIFPQIESYNDVLDIQTAAKSDYIITYYPEELHTTPVSLDRNKIIHLGNRFNSKYSPSAEKFSMTSTIYVSFGTVFNEKPELFKLFIDFFEKAEHKVIISTGSNESVYKIIKQMNKCSNIEIYQFVNQLDMLSRSSLFITHAGFNSMYEGLYFTVPMLMIPHVPEQYFNAQKIQELYAGYLLREENISYKFLTKSMKDIENNWQSFKSVLLEKREYFLNSNDNIVTARQIIDLYTRHGSK